MKPSKIYEELCKSWFARAKTKGVKFRNKDLRKLLKTVSAKTLNDLFDLHYCASAKMVDGELTFTNPIVESLVRRSYFLDLIEKNETENLFYQPVILSTKHGLKD